MAEDKSEDTDNKSKTRDVDSGYAWVILAGCFFMYLFVVGTLKAYGILYTEIVDYYGSGSGSTAWVGSVCLLLMLALGPISNLLSKKFSFRSVTFVGGILLGLGYFSSGLVSTMEVLYLTFGICCGLGYGLTFSPCSTIISFYFKKHRALANGITVSASGIGALTFPLFYKFLIEQFGLPGTLWIMGGIVTNVCVAACLFRQPALLLDEIKRKIATENRESDQKALLNGDNSCLENDGKKKKPKSRCNCDGLDLRFSLFKNPLFTMYAIAFTFCMNGYGNNLILIPAHLKALGYDRMYVALGVTILGGCEVVSRIVFGWFADMELIKRKNIFLISMFISAIFAFIAPMFDSFLFMAIYAAIVGIFPGSFWSLISVIVIDVVGMEDFSPAFGLISLCLALGAAVSQPMIGWLQDHYGSWNPSFILTGCLLLLAGITVLFEPIVVRCCVKKEPADEYLNMFDNFNLRRRAKPIPKMEEDDGSLLDEDVNVSFSSHRISKIYRPYKPESPPRSPLRTFAPIADPSEV